MTSSADTSKNEVRIAKAIARSGLCSRRDAEKWIFQGRVTINGKRLDTPACNISEKDVVMVDGKPLPQVQTTRLWRYNKPKGLVTTHKDPEGRPTVFDSLDTEIPRVISIGRLDINTEGLLLLTTDGQLARALELPSTGWLRRYRVRANGKVTDEQLAALKGGITVDGIKYGSIDARLEREQGTNNWITMALREGKNREIKNVLGALGLQVNRLIRISYGPFSLGEMPTGNLIEVKKKALIEQLGRELAQEVGLVSEAKQSRGHGQAKARPPRSNNQTRNTTRPRNPKQSKRNATGNNKSNNKNRSGRQK